MKIQVIKIGKPAQPEYAALIEEYAKRLGAFYKVDDIVLKAREGVEQHPAQLEAALAASQVIVALDERGKLLSSPALAEHLTQWQNESHVKLISFVIGGPYGLHPDIRKRATLLWSLSPAVFPSDIAWLVTWEQLYRAATIQRGGKYHHE